MKTKSFDKLLTKKVTRQEFITYIGLLLLAVTGISGLAKKVNNPKFLGVKTKSKSQKGFGISSYGGIRKVNA